MQPTSIPGASMATGIVLHQNPNLVIPDGMDEVPRTWRERLFSWPWRPLQAFKRVPRTRPDPCIYFAEHGRAVGHPETIRTLVDWMEGSQAKEPPEILRPRDMCG